MVRASECLLSRSSVACYDRVSCVTFGLFDVTGAHSRDPHWEKADARRVGGVLNHESVILNEDDHQRVRLVPERGNWEDIVKAVENGEAKPYLPSGKPLLLPYMIENKKGNTDLPFKRLRFDEGMQTVICRAVPHTQQ